jgi:TPR repeat protein
MIKLQSMSLEEIYEYAQNMTKIDEQKSLNALHYAAEKGHIPSQVLLGDIYSSGDIIEQDYDKSFYYYLKEKIK